MNNIKLFTRALLAHVASLLLAVPVSAQQYTISNTTLNGAISGSATSLVLTSASASSGSSFGAPAAGQCLFVDGELMRIVSLASTTVTVTRAIASAVGHANGAIIWTAPCNAFKEGDPPMNDGVSTSHNSCSTQPAPWINVTNGNIWWCSRANNTWSGTNYRPLTYNSVPTSVP